MTEATLQKLETAFLLGCSDREACLAAGIAPSTLYAYAQENPAFSEQKETLKTNPQLQARRVVLKALEDGDLSTAHKILDRKEGSKMAISGSEDKPPLTLNIIGVPGKPRE
jgi:hypothetical protein